MKKISLLIFLLAFPSMASAYDDETSAKALVSCLIKNQKKQRFESGAQLIMACDKEHKDFLIHNNCALVGIGACEGPVGEVIFNLMQKYPRKK